jgi:hypothetical protein
MWQVVHNPNITATIHLEELSVVEVDADFTRSIVVLMEACTTILISISTP